MVMEKHSVWAAVVVSAALFERHCVLRRDFWDYAQVQLTKEGEEFVWNKTSALFQQNSFNGSKR